MSITDLAMSMAFGVPFNAVLGLVRHLFEVSERDEAKSLARLRNMQREGFPPGVNVGRGVKISYGIEQITAVLFYHMMIDAGFPPDFAIRLYGAYRGKILAVAVHDDSAVSPSGQWPGPGTKVVTVTGNILSSRSDRQDARPLPGEISSCQLIELFAGLNQLLGRPAGVHVLDMAGTLGRALAHLEEQKFTTLDESLQAIRELRKEVGAV